MLGQFIAPDWRDVKQYPDPRQASPSHWAWEFLRRNKEYQEDWARYAALVQKVAEKHPETKPYVDYLLVRTPEAAETLCTKFSTEKANSDYWNKSNDLIFDRHNHELFVYEPPLKDGESKADYEKRAFAQNHGYSRNPMNLALGNKWGLKDILPPQSDTVGYFGANFTKKLGSGFFMPDLDKRDFLMQSSEGRRGERAIDLLNDIGRELGKPELVTITFDLTMPLDEQVEGALRMLKAKKHYRAEKKEIRPVEQQQYQAGLYVQYLRAYDAKLKGVRPSAVAKILRPNDKNNTENGYGASTKISTWVNRAEQLVERDYIFIPLAANSAAKRKPKKTVNKVKKSDSKN
jgi:Family of unknown function (DUF6499)/Uncharacterized conserved protein (DUF2285)